tara:strand:- start:214 stop:384 length:171 start_codon:yes stop_codon:yes gene_type:complete
MNTQNTNIALTGEDILNILTMSDKEFFLYFLAIAEPMDPDHVRAVHAMAASEEIQL